MIRGSIRSFVAPSAIRTSTHALTHALLEAIEARVLLANTVVFTDVDGDQVTVKLTGPGEVAPALSGMGSGFITDLVINGTTDTSSLSISVKTPSGGGGDGRVVMQGMSTAELKSFKAPTTDASGSFVTQLTSLSTFVIGDIDAGVTFNISPPSGRTISVVGRVLAGDLNVEGRVTSLRAEDTLASFDLNILGAAGSIRVAQTMQGQWVANNYGSITAEDMRANVLARVPDARGYAYGTLRFGVASQAVLKDDELGRLRSLTVAGDWNNGMIEVAGIDTLRIGDDFRPSELRLRDENPAVFSIRTATINDEAEGDWRLGSKVGTLRIGEADGVEVESTSDNTHIGTLAFTSIDTSSNGEWEAASIRTLSAKFDLGGSIDVFGLIPGTDRSIGSFTAKRVINLQFDVSGGVGSLTANQVEGSNLVAGYFGAVNIRAGGGFAGELLATDLRANSQDSRDFSVRSLSVAGLSDDSVIMGRRNIGPAKFGRFLDTVLFAGSTNPAGPPPVFGNTATLDPLFAITSFTVTRAFDAGVPALGNGVRVTAGSIGRITINGFTDPANGGNLNGFVSAAYGTIKLKSLAGANIGVTLNLGGDANPFAPTASDFVFRLLIL